MENEQQIKNDKESITLEYTAKGLANWTIRLKEDVVSIETINKLCKLDKEMRVRFPISVMEN